MANKISEATTFRGVTKLLEKNRYRASISIDKNTLTKSCHTFGEAVTQRLIWEHMRDDIYAKRQKVNQHICTDNCKSCEFMKWLDSHQSTPYCDYYLMTEHRRPCKAGDNCTVKKPRTKDHNDRYKKYYIDSFYHTEEHKWRKARVDSELNIIEK